MAGFVDARRAESRDWARVSLGAGRGGLWQVMPRPSGLWGGVCHGPARPETPAGWGGFCPKTPRLSVLYPIRRSDIALFQPWLVWGS